MNITGVNEVPENVSSSSESESQSVVSNSLWPHGLYPWNSPGQNTGVGSLSLLQGIFPTQGSNPGLPHCRQVLYQLSHKGSPRVLEWVAYPFSGGSSWPRNWTGVSWIAGRFLYQLSDNFYFKCEFKLSLEDLSKTGRKKTESLDGEDSNKK